MATQKLRVTRAKLSEFIPDHDTVKQFEQLFALVNALELDGTETLEEIIERVHITLP